jgi:hypothetical protein
VSFGEVICGLEVNSIVQLVKLMLKQSNPTSRSLNTNRSRYRNRKVAVIHFLLKFICGL